MEQLDFLRGIKSVTFSTVEEGKPKARIIDVMFIEDDKIFFTTARGKSFYRQLMSNSYIAITGMDKNYRTVRIHGKVRKTDKELLEKIFHLNPMMNDLYAGEKREILEVFCVYEGDGEILDLGATPPKRERFAFGKTEVIQQGYHINKNCISCGICATVCPENCISSGEEGFVINRSYCIECGRCYENCPADAINLPARF